MAIKVTSEVKVYGEKLDDNSKPPLYVHSHWNDDKMVEIEVSGTDGVRNTKIIVKVWGPDMIEAVKNAMNVNRWG